MIRTYRIIFVTLCTFLFLSLGINVFHSCSKPSVLLVADSTSVYAVYQSDTLVSMHNAYYDSVRIEQQKFREYQEQGPKMLKTYLWSKDSVISKQDKDLEELQTQNKELMENNEKLNHHIQSLRKDSAKTHKQLNAIQQKRSKPRPKT